jgi:hypothetical protein
MAMTVIMVKTNRPINLLLILVLVFLFLIIIFGCSDEASQKNENIEENRYWQKIKELYEKAKDSGEKVPEDILEWAKEDIKRAGKWDYKIVFIDPENENDLEQELNMLGNERWECFWVQAKSNGLTLFLKRSAKSYLKEIPLREIIR